MTHALRFSGEQLLGTFFPSTIFTGDTVSKATKHEKWENKWEILPRDRPQAAKGLRPLEYLIITDGYHCIAASVSLEDSERVPNVHEEHEHDFKDKI